MSCPTLRSSLRATSCGALLCLAACEHWHLSVNADGLVFIAVVGDVPAGDRFRVRIRQSDGGTRVANVPATGRLTLSHTAAGTLELTLLPPAGCRVSAPNPRVLTVAADETVRVSFDVRCG